MNGTEVLLAVTDAVLADSRSLYRISQDHKIGYSILQRMVTGHSGDLRLATAARIAEAVGHEIVVRPKRSRKGG